MYDISEITQYSKKLNLLYVEDNQDTRELTNLLLNDFFDSIILSKNGEDGYEKFIQNDIDIVITDIHMPYLNGLDMAQKIKQINPDIPILIFSANNDTDYFIQAIKIDIDGYLIKPINLTQFQQSLSKCINAIKLQKENEEYKISLEQKVQKQIEILRKKDEVLLHQSKFAAMGEMIDIIAHQWKQPLNAITMSSSILHEDIKQNLEISKSEFQECYDTINYQVDYLTTTLDEFRAFFRPNISKKKLNLDKIVKSSLLLLKDELLKNQVDVKVICDKDLFIEINENDIKQLIINIVSNAKDAIVKSDIASKDRKIIIDCSKIENKTIIKIKNNGDKIDQNIINDIFKMNFTTKSEDGGTGIGLYMCWLICEKYMATIEASNEDLVTFKITFD